MKAVLSAALCGLVACTGAFDDVSGGSDPAGPDAGDDAQFDDLDKDRAMARFVTTTDLMRYVVAPGCAAETNECHSNEDFPDMHTEGNLWNLVGLPCNQGVGDRATIDGFCEQRGDTLRIDSGANAGFEAVVGSIETVTDDDGAFAAYRVVLDAAPAATDAGAGFSIVRDGAVLTALGGGSSLDATAQAAVIDITRAGDLPDPTAVRQGDENLDGAYGTGTGVVVRAGDANASYLVMRLRGEGTPRERMPLGANADNPTERNRRLSPDEMYAVTSWINCMVAGDGPYSPIRYDCAANADNGGTR